MIKVFAIDMIPLKAWVKEGGFVHQLRSVVVILRFKFIPFLISAIIFTSVFSSFRISFMRCSMGSRDETVP